MRRFTFSALLLALVVGAAQTRLHGPSQLRDSAPGASAAWYRSTLSFGQIQASQCAERNFGAAGVSSGMPIAAGWPAELPPTVTGIMYPAAGIVVVRLCAVQTVSIPSGLTYSAAVLTWR